jgi:hypothetical protein
MSHSLDIDGIISVSQAFVGSTFIVTERGAPMEARLICVNIFTANRFKNSVGVKELTQLFGRNIPAGLTEKSVAGSGIQLIMVRNSKRLLLASLAKPTQFHMTASLRNNGEPEFLKDRNNFVSGKSSA